MLVDESEAATILTVDIDTADENPTVFNQQFIFQQTEDLVEAGIAVQKYGAYIIPTSAAATEITITVDVGGTTYTGATAITAASAVDATVTLNKSA